MTGPTPHPPSYLSTDDLTAMGRVPGVRPLDKFGRNPSIGTGTAPEDVWSGGGQYPFLTSAQSLELVSSNANDAAGGTGAREVQVELLDANFDRQTVTVVPNGTTPVPISGTWIRGDRGFVSKAGSSQFNEGDILVRVAGGGSTVLELLAGQGQTEMAIRALERNRTMLLHSVHATVLRASGGSSGLADMRLVVRSGLDGAEPVRAVKHLFSVSTESAPRITFDPPRVIVGPADVWLECAAVSQNNTSITGQLDGKVVVTG